MGRRARGGVLSDAAARAGWQGGADLRGAILGGGGGCLRGRNAQPHQPFRQAAAARDQAGHAAARRAGRRQRGRRRRRRRGQRAARAALQGGVHRGAAGINARGPHSHAAGAGGPRRVRAARSHVRKGRPDAERAPGHSPARGDGRPGGAAGFARALLHCRRARDDPRAAGLPHAGPLCRAEQRARGRRQPGTGVQGQDVGRPHRGGQGAAAWQPTLGEHRRVPAALGAQGDQGGCQHPHRPARAGRRAGPRAVRRAQLPPRGGQRQSLR
mmetsp:Transcript_7786/g.23820  ORF Transcript_7786/g.23820 Transcript_7786/m.23820 type:complete len:270 (+) Transcript_7786:623-1432(+)